ncbi:unnamed protein product [Penicillium camemberti]|uniref:Str. FM013 n=1 Tax=Penicillium camemberti (strain FM 013) TaxID=1429867 RepID=A0A0G4NU22_PENC3|nr:unnamed protein product [Penicillium camemberti]
MASKKSELPNPKRINYPPTRRSRRLAGLVPQTIFLEKADPPPGSPTWRAEPMDGTKPTRWASTGPLEFSSEPAKLSYDEWEGEYGAQKRMTDARGLTNCVPVYYLWNRYGNGLARILHGLEEIKQIITDWGQEALSMESMGFV